MVLHPLDVICIFATSNLWLPSAFQLSNVLVLILFSDLASIEVLCVAVPLILGRDPLLKIQFPNYRSFCHGPLPFGSSHGRLPRFWYASTPGYLLDYARSNNDLLHERPRSLLPEETTLVLLGPATSLRTTMSVTSISLVIAVLHVNLES